MKVALCFWGLTRSLKHTIHSIKKRILTVLTNKNIEYKIFIHTYHFNGSYINPRAQEYNIDLDFEEYKLLNPDYVEIEDQDAIKIDLNIFKYRTHSDPWNSGYISVDNFICAMHSKKQLGLMVENCDEKFDFIIYLRPDVKYQTYFDVKYFSLVNKYTICTPNFHLFPKLNDRFCILSYHNLKQYYSLFDKMYEYSLHFPLHSERFQYYIFINQYKWNIKYVSFFFNRVRANGLELNDIKKVDKQKKTKKNRNTPIKPDQNKVIQPIFKLFKHS
tara:strand:- start:4966 stop:5787 length:822 start_codon:yes stop_codon:yes gene_type:complete